MSPKRFDQFYFTDDGQICSVDDVAEYADRYSGKIVKYEGKMYCPECRQAQLTFVHRTSIKKAHLRRIPSSFHQNNCSYNYEYALPDCVKQYFSLMTENEIDDKLNSILYMLCREKQSAVKPYSKDGATEKTNPMCVMENTRGGKTIRCLRRKSLNAGGDGIRKEKTDEIFVFYGKVKLHVEKRYGNNGALYYLLQIFAEQRGGGIIQTRTCRYKIRDVIDEECLYDIAMIGTLNFKYPPFSVDLLRPSAIKFCKDDE